MYILTLKALVTTAADDSFFFFFFFLLFFFQGKQVDVNRMKCEDLFSLKKKKKKKKKMNVVCYKFCLAL